MFHGRLGRLTTKPPAWSGDICKWITPKALRISITRAVPPEITTITAKDPPKMPRPTTPAKRPLRATRRSSSVMPGVPRALRPLRNAAKNPMIDNGERIAATPA